MSPEGTPKIAPGLHENGALGELPDYRLSPGKMSLIWQEPLHQIIGVEFRHAYWI
jgi:hypothetical protein